MISSHGEWVWRKSSFSQGAENSDCVEVGHWCKSTYSEANGNSDCVEVGFGLDVTAIRDSKNPDGGMLALSTPVWDRFRSAVVGTDR
jgi:uncharacterized protein DUF397